LGRGSKGKKRKGRANKKEIEGKAWGGEWKVREKGGKGKGK